MRNFVIFIILFHCWAYCAEPTIEIVKKSEQAIKIKITNKEIKAVGILSKNDGLAKLPDENYELKKTNVVTYKPLVTLELSDKKNPSKKYHLVNDAYRFCGIGSGNLQLKSKEILHYTLHKRFLFPVKNRIYFQNNLYSGNIIFYSIDNHGKTKVVDSIKVQ